MQLPKAHLAGSASAHVEPSFLVEKVVFCLFVCF